MTELNGLLSSRLSTSSKDSLKIHGKSLGILLLSFGSCFQFRYMKISLFFLKRKTSEWKIIRNFWSSLLIRSILLKPRVKFSIIFLGRFIKERARMEDRASRFRPTASIKSSEYLCISPSILLIKLSDVWNPQIRINETRRIHFNLDFHPILSEYKYTLARQRRQHNIFCISFENTENGINEKCRYPCENLEF